MKQNWERQQKHGKRKLNQWKWLNENEITDSNSLMSFEFQRKINIRDINSSSSDNEEEGAEAVACRCSAAGSVEKMFLEISQNSQENTYARVFFNKVSGLLRNFQEHLFSQNTSGGCFCTCWI